MIKKKIKKIFRLWIYYTFSMVFIISCAVTKKQRDRICSTCPVVSTDSVIYKEKTVLKDTIIYTSSNPVIQYIQLECDSNFKVKNFSQTKYNNGVKNIVSAIGGVLISECNTDSLKKIIQVLRHEKEIVSKGSKEKTITTNILTPFEKFCIKFFWGFCITFIIFVLYKLIRIYIKSQTSI